MLVLVSENRSNAAAPHMSPTAAATEEEFSLTGKIPKEGKLFCLRGGSIRVTDLTGSEISGPWFTVEKLADLRRAAGVKPTTLMALRSVGNGWFLPAIWPACQEAGVEAATAIGDCLIVRLAKGRLVGLEPQLLVSMQF